MFGKVARKKTNDAIYSKCFSIFLEILPSKRFIYLRYVIEELKHPWDKESILSRKNYYCVYKLEKLWGKLRYLLDHTNRDGEIHKRRKSDFENGLEELFDVKYAIAMYLMKNN